MGRQILKLEFLNLCRTPQLQWNPRFKDLRYNDIPGITINNLLPTQQSYSKMYGTDPWYNDIPGLRM